MLKAGAQRADVAVVSIIDRASFAGGTTVEHLVRFTTAEGREGQHQASTLEDALKFVEHLRNAEEATDVRVYRMHQVPIEFKAYYRVEVNVGESDGATQPSASQPVEVPTEAAEGGSEQLPSVRPLPVPAPAEAQAEADGGRRLFARS